MNYKAFPNKASNSVPVPTMEQIKCDTGVTLVPTDFEDLPKFDADDFKLGVQLKAGVSMSEIKSLPSSRLASYDSAAILADSVNDKINKSNG